MVILEETFLLYCQMHKTMPNTTKYNIYYLIMLINILLICALLLSAFVIILRMYSYLKPENVSKLKSFKSFLEPALWHSDMESQLLSI